MPIPNIALFVRGRKWRYGSVNGNRTAGWSSNDGWVITNKDLQELEPKHRERLIYMLQEHELENELRKPMVDDDVQF